MANQIKHKGNDISFFGFEKNKLYKLILRVEPNLARFLFLTSTFLFLLENTILKLPYLLENIFNPFMWILMSIWILILFVMPIWIHSYLMKKQLKIFIKSFEMITSFIIFIGSFFIQFLPDFQICAYTIYGTACSTYPGGFLFGMIFILILILISSPIISKFSKNKELDNFVSDFDPILSKLQLNINDVKEKIIQNSKNLNKFTESFITSTNKQKDWDLYNHVDRYNDLIAQLYYFNERINIIQTNPKILDNRAYYAFEHNEFELGIRLSIKSVTNSKKVKKMELMKRFHTLALNLVGKKSFENAFNVFKFILINTRSLNILNFEIFSIVLNNLNYHSAYNAIKQREYKTMFRILEIRYKSLRYFYEKVKTLFLILIIFVGVILVLNIVN